MHPTQLSGARTHNLKSVDLSLTAGSVVAITGVSGSGKSSLALDTLYAEGQRRFVESFSPYARQFLERLERPPIDSLEPIAAGVAVDRKAPIKSSRSTLASMCDLTAYLAALFVREALPVCPEHGREAERQSTHEAASKLLADYPKQRAVLTYPVRVESVEDYLTLREELVADGYRRLWLQGSARDLDGIRPSEALENPELEVVIDRLKLDPGGGDRLVGSLETALRRGAGSALVHLSQHTEKLSDALSCPVCKKVLKPPQAGFFSFESPLGACAKCRGFGRTLGVSLARVIPDTRLCLAEGAIRPWRGKSTTWERAELKKLCKRHGISLSKPWSQLGKTQQQLILEGDGDWDLGLFPGVFGWFRWLETRTYKMHVRVLLSRYRSYDICSSCAGQRLSQASLSYKVGGINLGQWHSLEVSEALERLKTLSVATGQGKLIQAELLTRLDYLERVGLGYLSLDRQARTLSGGEAQRVTLTTALGTSLSNALFVLDEPSVGLHPSDIAPLNELIRELALRNNIALVIEHEPLLIHSADRVIELGPGAGEAGGTIVSDGPPRPRARANAPRERERVTTFTGALSVKQPDAHNLSFDSVEIPLGALVAITGPSGSGKSTLAEGIIYRGLARKLGDFDVEAPEPHAALTGGEAVQCVRLVDQSPLGRTSRGNAATYTKAWDVIRKRFSETSEAKGKSLTASHFSFNVAGGRCDACDGEGFETVEMQFLADVHLPCPVCKGMRFRPEILAVQDRGHSVADVLAMSVEQVLDTYRDERGVFRALAPVVDLGLGYLRLGQSLSTLSGGEAQRLKLARALCHDKPQTLFVFDEPSAGLHSSEVALVVRALDLLVRSGSSVIVVEHDLELIESADYVIDLGPGGGRHGGKVVAQGTPDELARTDSKTGRALAEAQRPGTRLARRKPQRKKPELSAPELRVTQAREHNLKELSVSIPHGKLSVVTGPSGSGKSTLAFDVIFAEGQRRFLETLTPYARQFLPSMARPDVSQVSGVPPAIALEQRTTRAGAKSTVATVTEAAHYLRLLFAKLGTPHCPDHAEPLAHLSADAILERVQKLPGKLTLLAPAVEGRKGVYLDLFTAAARAGITRAVVDGKPADTDDPPKLSRQKEHDISLLMAEAVRGKSVNTETILKALSWGKGTLLVKREGTGTLVRISERASCSRCGLAIPELDPRFFSFNTKQGQCTRCEGDGVIEVVSRGRKQAEAVQYKPCPKCQGTRLSPLAAGVRLQGTSYPEFLANSVDGATRQAQAWRFSGVQAKVAAPAVSELMRRLEFLSSVGLGYLGLDRAASTLSGGEMQRLRLAAQLGTGLTGALYVLDEPTIGLHPSDTERLLTNLRRLVDTGSSVLVVEHDADTIRAADHLIDLGPTGGAGGGHVMAAGPPASVLATKTSPTARALSGPPELRTARQVKKQTAFLELRGASQHNLRGIDIRVPLGHFSVVAGVSGSGKSTLVRSVLLPALRHELGLVAPPPGSFNTLTGAAELRRAVAVDQSPIGRTPRSVPATFLGIWDHIRRLFSESPEAKVRGFNKGRFSFNAKGGGRCDTCGGMGSITHEMSFLPDVTTPCPSCDGQRFEPRTLEVRYLGLSIGEVLALTAKQAAHLFEHHPKIARPLATLSDLGADYITLGQGSQTLSGGEAQRLKLAAELTPTERHEPTLYVLDEPTTGLHLADVAKLMNVLDRLVERGDTLVVIEHHPEVIAGADWMIELGPASGEGGGRVVAMGEPKRLLKKNTKTTQVLRGLLG